MLRTQPLHEADDNHGLGGCHALAEARDLDVKGLTLKVQVPNNHILF